jgi:LmbE family N-acetylglucosaminyl deacetylase
MTPTSAAPIRQQTPADVVASLGTILGVWAHPDDEAYLSAGLMAAATARGQRVTVVHATLGEHGTDDPDAWPPARLAPVRRDELTRSLRTLGVPPSHLLGHIDGTCADVDPLLATEQLVQVIESAQPDTIVTFGPDGMTGHPDHRAVSRWVRLAWEATGRPARLLHAAVTTDWVADQRVVNDQLGAFAPGFPDAVDPTRVAVALALDEPRLDQKVAALRAHESQTAALERAIGTGAYRRWWSTETFVEAT